MAAPVTDTGARDPEPGAGAGPRTPESKILSLEEALEWRRNCRRHGIEVVLTNGCFDLLHRGHVEYLARARSHGGALLVAVNADTAIAAIKGPGRPVVPESDRVYLLASLEAVDVVLVFPEADAIRVLTALAPDVYIKGGDYDRDTINRDEGALLSTMDCRLEFVGLVPGLSTTDLIRRVRRLPE